MRHPDRLTVLWAVLVSLSLSVLLMKIPAPQGEASWITLVPADVVGFAKVQNVSEAYGLLQAGAFADLVGGEMLSQLETAGWTPEAIVSRLVDFDLKELGVVLHSLERRAANTYKLDFSVILVPGPGGAGLLMNKVKTQLEGTLNFSADTDVDEIGVKVYRGREPRQVLFLATPGQVLVISNGRDLLQEMEMARSGRLLRLTDRRTFQMISSHLPGSQGVFVYIDGRRFLGLFPEMGWRFWNENDQMHEAFYSASPYRSSV